MQLLYSYRLFIERPGLTSMASLIAFSRYLKALRKSRIFAIFVQEQDVISITYL